MAKIQLDITLQPKQWDLRDAILDRRIDAPTILGFGGSRGASKSGAVRRIAAELVTEKPGIIVWIIRRHWDDLNKDHVMTMVKEFPQFAKSFRAMDKELRISVTGEDGEKGTSSIFFIHAGLGGRGKRKARGPQAHYIFIEQAEEFTQEEIEQYDGSNRAPGTPPGFCKKILTFNPGGIGTAYLRRIFHLREYHDNEDGGSFLFIPGFGWDNYEWFRGLGIVSEHDFYHTAPWTDEMQEPILLGEDQLPANPSHRFTVFIHQTDFGIKLRKLPPSQRIGELMGSFERFAGQYYADVWEESAIMLPVALVNQILQPWWRRWLATDWGFSHFAATYWACAGLLSPEQALALFGVRIEGSLRIIIIYREMVCSDTAEPILAKGIADRTPPAERRVIRDHWLSPDAWQKRGGGNTVKEQIEPVLLREGMPALSQARTDRIGGWRLLYNCWSIARKFRKWVGSEPFRQTAEDPPLLFVSWECPEVARAVPMLICDEDNPTDVRKVPGAMEDDIADAVRYLIKSYLDAEPKPPDEIVARETFERYQDPNQRAMAMLRLQAEQSKHQHIRRRIRG